MKTVLPLLLALAAGQVQVSSPKKSQKEAPAVRATPIIQVSSTTITPNEIHTGQKPNEATVTVQVAVLGDLPPHSEATVEVGTYSTNPPNNEVTYPNQHETLPLKGSPTVFHFKVRASPKTVSGSIIIAAGDLKSATPGIKVIRPLDTEGSLWQTELKIIVP